MFSEIFNLIEKAKSGNFFDFDCWLTLYAHVQGMLIWLKNLEKSPEFWDL